MPYKILVLLLIVFAGCKKNSGNSNCEALKNALVANNTETVRTIIDETIEDLLHQGHTPKNLQKLADKLNRCGTTANANCILCIYTNPPISQIRLSFTQNGTAYDKTISIKSISVTDNTMRFLGAN